MAKSLEGYEWLGAGKHGATYRKGDRVLKVLYDYWERKRIFPSAQGPVQTVRWSRSAFRDLAKQGCAVPTGITFDTRFNTIEYDHPGKVVPTPGADLVRLKLREGGPALVRKYAAELAKMHAAGWFHWDVPLTAFHLLEEGRPVLCDVGNLTRVRLRKEAWFKAEMLRTLHDAMPKAHRALFVSEYYKNNRVPRAVGWGIDLGLVGEASKARLEQRAAANRRRAKPASLLKRLFQKRK